MELNLKTENNIAKDIDFEKTINESRASILAEGQKPARKGRSDKGRLRKPTETPPVVNTSAGNININAAPTPQAQQVDISPYLAVPIEMISKSPAKKYDIPELALTKEEALECAKALNECFNVFVPNINQMSPKTAAVMGVFMVVGSIGFTKYTIYADVMEKRKLLKRENNDVGSDKQAVEPEIKLEAGRILAENYFNR